MFTRRLLLFVLTLVPGPALAQGWDVSATTGLFARHTPRVADSTGYQELWVQGGLGGATLGRHLTSHLKLELEGSATTEGTQLRERTITVPGYPYPYPLISEVTTSVRSIAAGLTYQFGRNDWVHPFVHAGVTADFERVIIRTPEQFFYGSPRPSPEPNRLQEERTEGPTTTRALRAVLGGGAKVYVTEKTFVRTEGRWLFGSERHAVAARIGFGLDF